MTLDVEFMSLIQVALFPCSKQLVFHQMLFCVGSKLDMVSKLADSQAQLILINNKLIVWTSQNACQAFWTAEPLSVLHDSTSFTRTALNFDCAALDTALSTDTAEGGQDSDVLQNCTICTASKLHFGKM